MDVRSLGYQTDLIFPAFDGEIIDRGHYLVVRTPGNPGYFWGNFLLFSRPPGPGDHGRWTALFAEEIGSPPYVGHQTFGWDSTEPEVADFEPFLADGFHLDHSHVLIAEQLWAARMPPLRLSIRPLESPAEWEWAIENQVASRESHFTEAGYRLFRQRQMSRYRAMAAEGLGSWYGAFLGDRLAADLGIFAQGPLGRYQAVETHPDFRRKGIGGALVVRSAEHAQRKFGIQTLVIVADADSPAERLYHSLGFRYRESQFGLEKWSPETPAAA
jgi:GNAT superfamily N-acetyltransferase